MSTEDMVVYYLTTVYAQSLQTSQSAAAADPRCGRVMKDLDYDRNGVINKNDRSQIVGNKLRSTTANCYYNEVTRLFKQRVFLQAWPGSTASWLPTTTVSGSGT
jgi:hypothetical protein